MKHAPDPPRRRLGWLVGAIGVAAFVWWVFATLDRQSSLDLLTREVVQADGQWVLRGRAFNQGPALARAYVEVQYFEAGRRDQSHRRFEVPDVPAGGEFPFVVGPLPNLDPQRRKQVSVYIGAEPDPYGGM